MNRYLPAALAVCFTWSGWAAAQETPLQDAATQQTAPGAITFDNPFVDAHQDAQPLPKRVPKRLPKPADELTGPLLRAPLQSSTQVATIGPFNYVETLEGIEPLRPNVQLAVGADELQLPASILPASAEEPLPEPTAANPPEPSQLSLPDWLSPLSAAPTEDAPPTTADLETESDPSESAPTLADSAHQPSRASALYAQAEKLAREAKTQGDLTDVMELCQRGLEGDTSDALSHQMRRLTAWAQNRRGELRLQAGEDRAAFDDFNRAVALDDSCWEALHNRGVTLASYQKTAEALRDFDAAIEANPECAAAYANRGELLLTMGRPADAVTDFSKVLELLPNESPAIARRGAAYHQLGKLESALQDYNEALRLEPQNVSLLTQRANVYSIAGYYEAAVVGYDAALKIDPRNAATYQGVAWLLATCPEPKFRSAGKALEAARRNHALGAQDDPLVFDTLAVAHASAGDFDTAVRYAQQAALMAEMPYRGELEQRMQQFRKKQPYVSRPASLAQGMRTTTVK